MSFRCAALGAKTEREVRINRGKNLLSFGIRFLDDALLGIGPGDVVLLGAPTGKGKTQICMHFADSNILAGKRVYYFALEADEMELESRLKFRIVSTLYFADPNRPRLPIGLDYGEWYDGFLDKQLSNYEERAEIIFAEQYKTLFFHYKHGLFTFYTLAEEVLSISGQADLIIIDHAHYFDFDDENENRALKKIASTVRDLALNERIPVILVAHLRKRQWADTALVPDINEFHGTSDLTKIATRIVLFEQGSRTPDNKFETFFRAGKSRVGSGVDLYCGRCLFDPKRGSYEDEYKLGWSNQSRKTGFEELASDVWPSWTKRSIARLRSRDPSDERTSDLDRNQYRQTTFQGL